MTKCVYIHIPFCKSKCKYCSFVSITQTDIVNNYVESVINEIRHFYEGEELNTLYFGGGTPSLLSIKFIEKIINEFNLSNETEVTFEINPDDAEINYLKNLYNIGITRLSFGVQTFNDKVLSLIGRRHNSKQVFKAIEDAKKVDFSNISIDLIYGLPEQTIKSLQGDLEIIKSLDIQHISTYGLKIEEPSYFYYHPIAVPDGDIQADMYLGANEYLESNGFHRYEISNFARAGFESKHNMNYWNNAEYYGFGAAAHGYKDNFRYSNTEKIEKYINNPLERAVMHNVTPKEKLEEEIFLGFRRENGINTIEINKKYGIDFDIKYSQVIEKYSPEYIISTEQGYKLTLKGVLLSNNILADFLE